MHSLTKATLLTWENYLEYGKRQFFKGKSVIFQQGDAGNGFYYMKKGLIKIVSVKSARNERILDIVGPGCLIGEQAIDGLPYYSTSISHVDSVLYYYSNEDIEKLTQRDSDMISLLAQSLFSKEKLLLNNINATSADTQRQIAHSLLYLMNCCQSKEINLTQQELSLYVGLTRITIYKVLKEWAVEGIVSIQNRKIYILDPEVLKEKLFYQDSVLYKDRFYF